MSVDVGFAGYLPSACDVAQAGSYFDGAGRWGMAIALREVLGGFVVAGDRGPYLWSRGRSFDCRGCAPDVPADFELFDRDGACVEAVRSGIEKTRLEADIQWAAAIIATAREMADVATFETWFAGSCVKTPSGAPLIVYHGTAAGDIKEFRLDAGHEGNIVDSDYSLAGVGIFFTPDEQAADWYANNAAEMAGKNVDEWRRTIAAHVSLKRPMVYEDLAAANRAADEAGGGAALRALLQAQGFDGVVFGECSFFASQTSSCFGLEVDVDAGYHDVVVVFEPAQIRPVRRGEVSMHREVRPRDA